jgi:hypothetical protein
MRLRILSLALLLSSLATASAAEEGLQKGIYGVDWISTLEEVKATYPGGYLWPSTDKSGYATAYDVAVEADPFATGVGKPRVTFAFDRNDRLVSAFVFFPYQQRDAVLLRLSQRFGQSYTMKSESSQTVYTWTTQLPIRVNLRVGNTRLYDWAILGVSASELPVSAP